MAATMIQPTANVWRPPSVDCEHADVEVLGTCGSATYLRCGCGLLLVAQEGRMWPFGTALK